jgi:hypothetical protein
MDPSTPTRKLKTTTIAKSLHNHLHSEIHERLRACLTENSVIQFKLANSVSNRWVLTHLFFLFSSVPLFYFIYSFAHYEPVRPKKHLLWPWRMGRHTGQGELPVSLLLIPHLFSQNHLSVAVPIHRPWTTPIALAVIV